MTTQSATLRISGMHCGSCASKISTSLLKLDGIESADVSPQRGEAVILGRPLPDNDDLRDAVTSAGDYALTSVDEVEPAAPASEPLTRQHYAMVEEQPKESLYPLFLIVGFIAGVTLLVAVSTGNWSAEPLMRHFMAGFFIVFSFFKLLDPPGFVSAYRGYDLVARKVPAWGWAYPFVELMLGVAYLLAWVPVVTNAVTLVLMLVGAAGVLKALLDKRAIRCACLGTALNLPMTKVTLVEDLTMAAMAAVMLGLML
ncbi:MAG: MauE/DoxX family redox-associated membrane protein [Planctomycetota bacterium]